MNDLNEQFNDSFIKMAYWHNDVRHKVKLKKIIIICTVYIYKPVKEKRKNVTNNT